MRWMAAALAALLAASPAGALAQEWPTKPIRMLVAFAAGGPVDVVAREVAARLGEQLGQTVVVENQGGAGGKIALGTIARAAPDGHTLLFAASGNVVILPLVEKKPDLVRDLLPVSLVSTSAHALVVNSGLPIRNVRELIDYAKANPGKVHFGSSGTGAAAHLGMELFKSLAGVDVVHVPYKGISQAVIDLQSGDVQAMFSSMPSLKAFIDRGSIRPIGMTAPSRGESGLPLIAEALPGFEYTVWYGVFAPPKTPGAIVDKLNAAIRAVVADPELQKKLEAQSLDLQASTPDELTAHMRKESAKWEKVVREANVTME